jgi:histidinol-phosphate aminotransferase
MQRRQAVSRRGFVGGVATAVGYLGVRPAAVWAEEPGLAPLAVPQQGTETYDGMAKLGNNENPWGPPETVMKAMTRAWKYSNRYGYPDGDVQGAIAEHHGVKPENILMAAGSGEILRVVGNTFLDSGKKVVGVEPSYASVYQHASNLKAESILLPLEPDYRQNIPAMIAATRRHYREVGFVYLVNPNNPTGRTVTKQEVRQLLDGIPEDTPVLIDEAYHHYVEDPEYATSVPYVLEGRQVIIARTFSKIYGMAGMRLGYAIAPRQLVQRMNPNSTGTINALVKWGGVAALQDTETVDRVRRETIALRNKTTSELKAMGYDIIPSEANFFMVHIRRPVQPVIEEFRKRGVIVGRPFPPMTEHLRVSVGTTEEMGRLMTAWKSIFTSATAAGSRG